MSVLRNEQLVTSQQLSQPRCSPRVWTVYIVPSQSSSGDRWERWAQLSNQLIHLTGALQGGAAWNPSALQPVQLLI